LYLNPDLDGSPISQCQVNVCHWVLARLNGKARLQFTFWLLDLV